VSPDASSPPVLTLFGSTNLNSRSAHIDTELSFIMVVPVASEQRSEKIMSPAEEAETTTNDNLAAMMSLRHRLADEITKLRAHAVAWRGGERMVRFWTKVIVQIVKGML
jgi:CDP-diacylglycerol--glycerol-3-phosphate 3-phosphatidyltransferase